MQSYRLSRTSLRALRRVSGLRTLGWLLSTPLFKYRLIIYIQEHDVKMSVSCLRFSATLLKGLVTWNSTGRFAYHITATRLGHSWSLRSLSESQRCDLELRNSLSTTVNVLGKVHEPKSPVYPVRYNSKKHRNTYSRMQTPCDMAF